MKGSQILPVLDFRVESWVLIPVNDIFLGGWEGIVGKEHLLS